MTSREERSRAFDQAMAVLAASVDGSPDLVVEDTGEILVPVDAELAQYIIGALVQIASSIVQAWAKFDRPDDQIAGPLTADEKEFAFEVLSATGESIRRL